MADPIMAACDLHDKTMLLKIAQGRNAAETVTVRNTSAGRARLIDRLRERSVAAGGAQVIFAYEASGQRFGLHDELTEAGIECHVLAPTKIARSSQHKRNKTDEKDAEQILQREFLEKGIMRLEEELQRLVESPRYAPAVAVPIEWRQRRPSSAPTTDRHARPRSRRSIAAPPT